MATTATERQEIKNSWSLLDFMRSHGIPRLGEFTNSDGEQFKSLMFPTPDGEHNNTPCRFSQFLKIPQTMQAIFENRFGLRVVQLSSGKYTLCQEGTGSWETSTHTAAEWGI